VIDGARVERINIVADGGVVAPEIVYSTDITSMVDAAEAALGSLDVVYTRARSLVRVVHDRSETHGLKYPKGQPVVACIGPEHLRELVNRSAVWIAITTSKKTGESERRRVMVPPIVPATLMDRGEWDLPPLEGVTNSPVLRADGTILDTPGYDPATRLIYEPNGVTFPKVATKPTQADAAKALTEMLEPFSEMPFVAESDRMAAAALILTLIGRAAIDGSTPMFTTRAPTPGSGKGLILDVAAMIATGRLAPKRAAIANDEELRKALFAYAIEAPAMVVLDNAEGAVGSPVLAAVLTTGTISDRMLGVSQTRSCSLRFVMAVTGNNLTFRGDLGRRIIPIDLDPRVEHAEDREFLRKDLIAFVEANRPRFVVAALTVLRAFYVAGRPSHGHPSKGSYEAWDRLVRGSIMFAGGADPLGGIERIRQDGDEDLDRLRAMLSAWDAAFGSMPKTIAEAIKFAGKEGALHDSMVVYCRSGTLESKPIASAFRKLRGRIAGGRELVREEKADRNGVMSWFVRTIEH